MHEFFRKFAAKISQGAGSPWAFLLALSIVTIWALTGPLFRFSDTWQLVINTGTTIVTFLMVFLIQNTQNRDAVALHLKLDELLRAIHGARTGLVNLENLSDEELARVQQQFERLARHQPRRLERVEEEIDEIEEDVDEVEEQVKQVGQTLEGHLRDESTAGKAATEQTPVETRHDAPPVGAGGASR